MVQSEEKTKRLTTIFIIAFNIVAIVLILVGLVGNISYELNSQQTVTDITVEASPTPVPTLSESELRDVFDQPVGEEGNE